MPIKRVVMSILFFIALAGCGGADTDESSTAASTIETLRGTTCGAGQTVRKISGRVTPALGTATPPLGVDGFQLPEIPYPNDIGMLTIRSRRLR